MPRCPSELRSHVRSEDEEQRPSSQLGVAAMHCIEQIAKGTERSTAHLLLHPLFKYADGLRVVAFCFVSVCFR